MRPEDFKRWRKQLKLSQKQAADALGLKRRIVQYYEKGQRDGEDVVIPKAVRLACYAIWVGVSDYDGPVETTASPSGTASRVMLDGGPPRAAKPEKRSGKPKRKAKKKSTAKK